MFFRQRRIWSFHVVVLQRSAKKCTKIQNARAQLLFCSLILLFWWRSRCRCRRGFVNSLMSADKHPSIFSRQMVTIVYIFYKSNRVHQISFKYFLQPASGIYISQLFSHVMGLEHSRARESICWSPQFSTVSKAERSLVQTTFNMAAKSGEVVFRAGEVRNNNFCNRV